MITTGLVLAGLSVGGFYLIYKKLPRKVRAWLMNRPLFTDAVAAALTYTLFGASTVTGLLAAAWAGVIVSIMLTARKNPVWMSYFEFAKTNVQKFFKWVEEYGKDRLIVAHQKDSPRLEIVTEK